METQSLEKKLSEILFDLVFLKRMDWKESLKKLQGEDNALVLDFGPGRISHRLTQSLFQNREITILSMANRSDRKLILS
jgi:malonyl CoA-acyl carrier protein transacylase